jgi:hypothetical protein
MRALGKSPAPGPFISAAAPAPAVDAPKTLPYRPAAQPRHMAVLEAPAAVL